MMLMSQVGMPASFMPVDSSPLGAPAALDAGQAASGGKGAAGTTLAAVATLPTSLPSMASFTSSLSCTTELDLPFSSAADLSAAAAASPSFGGSCDDSLHSDFTGARLHGAISTCSLMTKSSLSCQPVVCA